MSPLIGRVLNSKEKELTVVNVLSLGCVGVGVLVLTLQCHCARRCRCRELGNMEPLYFFFYNQIQIYNDFQNKFSI